MHILNFPDLWINVEMTPPLLASGTQEQSEKTPRPYFAPTEASFISYAYKKISMSENPHTIYGFYRLVFELGNVCKYKQNMRTNRI